MSWVTVRWSALAAAALTLGAVHLLVWLRKPAAKPHLFCDLAWAFEPFHTTKQHGLRLGLPIWVDAPREQSRPRGPGASASAAPGGASILKRQIP